ncbi:MAG: GTPase Era [Bryobacterales bacterium]|nr:GTPase Era [Bryobacterales bacterium]
MSDARHVSGFVSLIGRPNAGKSTLLNALIGTKIAIVADKPQTTRTTVQGVLTEPGAQVIFLDTPGIHKADSIMNRRMMHEVRGALDGRDLVLFLADASVHFSEGDRQAVDVLKNVEAPVLLVLNKIDLLGDKSALLPLIDRYRETRSFAACIPVSALRAGGLDILKNEILQRMPEGPQYFPEDQITDQPSRFLAAELIREKIIHITRQEVPHSVAVMIDLWEERKRLTRILATIYVEREGQKAIVIGSKGSALKQVGTLARLEMEKLFGVKIFLEMHVKVQPDWREKTNFLDALDWRTMAGTDESKT